MLRRSHFFVARLGHSRARGAGRQYVIDMRHHLSMRTLCTERIEIRIT
jgi:hypothetical protein